MGRAAFLTGACLLPGRSVPTPQIARPGSVSPKKSALRGFFGARRRRRRPEGGGKTRERKGEKRGRGRKKRKGEGRFCGRPRARFAQGSYASATRPGTRDEPRTAAPPGHYRPQAFHAFHVPSSPPPKAEGTSGGECCSRSKNLGGKGLTLNRS